MAHESFEDEEVAALLNAGFVCIKVDKEERPDIDSVYMSVCTALTGSGGWPLTIFMDAAQRPFFAGTYFPKHGRFGSMGLTELLSAITEQWNHKRAALLQSAENIVKAVREQAQKRDNNSGERPDVLVEKAVGMLSSMFDPEYGGFGRAPKFPAPHNLLFLLKYYQVTQDSGALHMAEKTLLQMAEGGIFDHIGFGFSRYSTDETWLVPHFEKMLYDNALLIMAYTEGFGITNNPIYADVAKKTIEYVLRELTQHDGGFYCAQDADSDGIEGKYYMLTPHEVISVLGHQDGKAFNKQFNITPKGNFEGKSIPNRIAGDLSDHSMERCLPALYAYRKKRAALHRDDKVLTAWNGLMIAALARAFLVFEEERYLLAAQRSAEFIRRNLFEDGKLFTSFRDGKRSGAGFIDDYAFYSHGLLWLYIATLDKGYLEQAEGLVNIAVSHFFDEDRGGFYLYGSEGEQLVMRPKESYDGAMPSGNSVMAWNLQTLSLLCEEHDEQNLVAQTAFMAKEASGYPAGHCFFLLSVLEILQPKQKIVVVLKEPDHLDTIKPALPKDALIVVLERETVEYTLKNNRTTYYVCENGACHPPVNELHPKADTAAKMQ